MIDQYVEYERQVIGKAMQSEDMFLQCEGLIAEHFTQDLHKSVWAELVREWADPVTLAERNELLGANISLLIDLTQNVANFITEECMKHYAQALTNRYRIKKVSTGVSEAIAQFGNTSNYEALVGSILSLTGDQEIETKSESLDKVLHRSLLGIEARHKGEVVPGLMTGLTDFDKRTGGLRGGDAWVVAGRPGMGKTAFALTVVKNHARLNPEHNVYVASLEMQNVQLSDRLISCVGRIDSRRLRDGDLQDGDWDGLTKAMAFLKGKSIELDDTGGIEIDQLCMRVRAAHRKKPLTLVVVDYIQLVRCAGKDSEYDRVTEVSNRLKQLAKDVDCPVMMLSQLNRMLENRPENQRRPRTSDLRSSGAIEQDADVITFVYRDEVYNEDTDHKGIAELITEKFRNGEPGTDYFAAEMQYTHFKDLDHNHIGDL